MAQRKPTPEDVEIARFYANLERARLICVTIQRCFLMAMMVACVGIISWAAVQISAKPPWVVIVLAVLSAVTPPSLVAWRLFTRLKRQVSMDEGVAERLVSDVAEGEETTGEVT